LRGRILDRARDATFDEWATFGGPMGVHAHADVVAMVSVLASEGLLERHATDPMRARLPQ
jgi:hypothetical protein